MNIDLTEKEIKLLYKALISNYAEDKSDFEEITNETKSDYDNLEYKILLKLGFESFEFEKNCRKLKKELRKIPIDRFPLFCGAGIHSRLYINKMHHRLDNAICYFGGSQQGGDEEEWIQTNKEIKKVLQDLIYAFDLTPEEIVNTNNKKVDVYYGEAVGDSCGCWKMEGELLTENKNNYGDYKILIKDPEFLESKNWTKEKGPFIVRAKKLEDKNSTLVSYDTYVFTEKK